MEPISRAGLEAAIADLDAHYSPLVEAAYLNERTLRAEAFYRQEITLAGIPCRLVTLSDFRYLSESKNGFFTGFAPDAPDTAVLEAAMKLIWWQAKERKEGRWARISFQRKLKRISTPAKIVGDVAEYRESLFQDTPAPKEKPNEKPKEQFWSYEADIIDSLASRYGWTIEYIMGLPLAKIHEFMNIIYAEAVRRNGETPMFRGQKSVRLQQEWVAKRQPLQYQLFNLPKESETGTETAVK